MRSNQSLTVLFKEKSGDQHLLLETLNNEKITLLLSDFQVKEVESLAGFMRENTILNLLNIQESEECMEAEFLIFEPDYLIDISSLAECFRPFGSHPLNYTLSRLRPISNTKHILLGNAANFFLDELVNEPGDSSPEYLSVLKKLFRFAPFEFTTCEDLADPQSEKEFFGNCAKHFEHIRNTIDYLFPQQQIDKKKAVIEPSFISNALGLQGRLDLMLHDFSAFVELKSGKAEEDFRSNNQFTHSSINHYTQMILYLAVLEFNLGLQHEEISSYLLYSKYPMLSREAHSREQLQKAISLRNEIVGIEFEIQRRNESGYTKMILENIQLSTLNTAKLSGNFFENYLRPSIDKQNQTFKRLNELEQTYFLRVYTFIVKELWLSKAGEKEYEGVQRAANLWNAPFSDKIEAGELLHDLKIIENQAASDNHFVVLEIPDYDEVYLPNFRPGDAVVLYEKNIITDTVNNKQVFKGAIEHLNGSRIVIRLRARQQNRMVLKGDSLYAIEHDYMDSSYTGMFRALHTFAEANQSRRDLLLGVRAPEFEPMEEQPEVQDDIKQEVSKAMAAKDCFLLVGPPGTGKTSLALKKMVETSLANGNGNILLLSYTNRAVDEMCKALVSISENIRFIRIGSELNCASEYRKYLLENQLNLCNRRSEVNEVINHCRIFVGTIASVWNKPELFNLKQFEIAIIDEATQLLEPHLIGILSIKTKNGANAVKRFVMIGDHKQLPAVVLQTKEESKVQESVLHQTGLTNLSNSLFERLYRKFREQDLTQAFGFLSCQGRMHPEIAAFPSKYFYDNKLKCAGLPHQNECWEINPDEAVNIKTLASNHRLAFIPVASLKNGTAKTSTTEAEVCANLAKALFEYSRQHDHKFGRESLGIITPYRNQIALIRKKLTETGVSELSHIQVDTIERFQGSQKDAIIFSFCVNTPGQLNTLPCLTEEDGQMIDRKLNVVLTRARKQLFITGDPSLLSKNPLYNCLINHIRENGVISHL